MDEEIGQQSSKGKLRRFIGECARVLRVTRKPDGHEFKTTLKITGLGIAVIGLIGFIITVAKQLIFG